MFNIDKIYQKYATILSNSTGYYCLKVLYKIINYIDDNLPVIKKRVLTKEETNLIKFLLFKGDDEDYIFKNGVSRQFVNSLVRQICDNFKCQDITTAINLVLIEKYKRKINNEFFEIVNK